MQPATTTQPVTFFTLNGNPDLMFRTYSGHQIRLDADLLMLSNQIKTALRDLIATLAKRPRHAGNMPLFYSEAQHACLVHDILWRTSGSPILALRGLLYNLHRVFNRPTHETDWISRAIDLSTGLPDQQTTIAYTKIKQARQKAASTEKRDLLESFDSAKHPRPWNEIIAPKAWAHSEDMYLSRLQKSIIRADLPTLFTL